MIRWLPDVPRETPASIAAAKQYQLTERAAFTKATGRDIDDDGRIAARLSNYITAAVYGARGERRAVVRRPTRIREMDPRD